MIVLSLFFGYSFSINMKRTITRIAIFASLAIILESFGFWVNLLEFFFAGIIPWTEYRVDPSLMLAIFSITAGLLIGKTFILPYIRKNNFSKTKRTTLKTDAKLA